MKQYLITNPIFTGEAIAIYNSDGLLMQLDVSQTSMGEHLIAYFKKALPARAENLRSAFKADTIIVESDYVIVFDMFWDKYDYKSNKIRAEPLWNRLSKTDKVLAFTMLDKYHKYLRKQGSQAKLHPDTYLRIRAWQNDYK